MRELNSVFCSFYTRVAIFANKIVNMENHRISRSVNIFDNQLIIKVFNDKTEYLTIVVDLENVQVSTSLWDCDLSVKTEHNQISVFLDSLNLGVC